MSLHTTIFKDVFHQALHALSDNKLRTVLSILGITVGIAAVMAVGTVTQGMKDYIYEELETYGLRSIWVYRNWGDEAPNRSIRQGSGISNDDYKLIQQGCCPSVVRVTPFVYAQKVKEKIRFNNEYYDGSIEGVAEEYTVINNDELISGRNFRSDDIERRKPVAIVAPKVAEALYGKNHSAMGKTFRLNDQKFTIIGVLAPKNRDLLSQIGADNYDVNGRVLIPYTLYQYYMGSKDIHTLQAEAVSIEETGLAMKQVKDMLNRRHGYRYDYTTENMDGWIAKADEVLNVITLIGIFLASISLLVGGMGIMNIMSTSVIERTREIGIRKAVGANNRDILVQFLMEATVVSTLGGVLGLILGIILAVGISIFSGYTFGPSWITAIIALLVSMLVGVLSGYYPAHRAAQLRPVDALRYE